MITKNKATVLAYQVKQPDEIVE